MQLQDNAQQEKYFYFFGYYIQIKINILIIFLTQYFQIKKMSQWLKSPLSTKGFSVQSCFQIVFFFHEENGLNKQPLANFFMLDALGRKKAFHGEETQRQFQPCSIRKQLPKCLTKMYKGSFFPNQMFFLPLEKSQNLDI